MFRIPWPLCFRVGSAAVHFLGLRVRLSQRTWMYFVSVVFPGRGLFDGRLLVQIIPTLCGPYLTVISKSQKLGDQYSLGLSSYKKKIVSVFMYKQNINAPNFLREKSRNPVHIRKLRPTRCAVYILLGTVASVSYGVRVCVFVCRSCANSLCKIL